MKGEKGGATHPNLLDIFLLTSKDNLPYHKCSYILRIFILIYINLPSKIKRKSPNDSIRIQESRDVY